MLSQWGTTLQCNVVSHWLSPYLEWPLPLTLFFHPVYIWLPGRQFQYAAGYYNWIPYGWIVMMSGNDLPVVKSRSWTVQKKWDCYNDITCTPWLWRTSSQRLRWHSHDDGWFRVSLDDLTHCLKHDGGYFTGDIFKCIIFLIRNWLKFVTRGPVDNKSALVYRYWFGAVQAIGHYMNLCWYSSPTHIYDSWLQQVKAWYWVLITWKLISSYSKVVMQFQGSFLYDVRRFWDVVRIRSSVC